ncbi:MAG: hypothetical protein WGN25_09770 [Candidatus Electrothrix sp. GW3-4]|uniref:hypothetical protein n=1 Tax=Candidatus Electrothrix sp. GW3-4 TaxID=3126740 RepID=UPI0030CC999F
MNDGVVYGKFLRSTMPGGTGLLAGFVALGAIIGICWGTLLVGLVRVFIMLGGLLVRIVEFYVRGFVLLFIRFFLVGIEPGPGKV